MAHLSSTLDNNPSLDYLEIFNQMPGCFVVLQPNPPLYTILAISDELLQITARSRKDIIGKGVFEVYPENPEVTSASGASQLRISLQNAILHKKADYMPLVRYDITNPGGEFETRYWSAHSKPVLSQSGEVLYIVHTTSDVTAQVRKDKATASLQKVEKAYSLFMQAPVAVCILVGPEHIVELANEEMLRIIGRSAEIVGKPLFDSVPEALDQGIPELLEQVRKSGNPFHAAEFPAQLLIDGQMELRYYNYIYQPYYQNEGDLTPHGVFIVAHDVTEQVLARKKVEEVKEQLDLRNALFEAHKEATPDGMLIVDASGKILLHNRRFVEIWNMPQHIIDSKDDALALAYARQQVADEQGFIDTVTAAYSRTSGPVRDRIVFKNGVIIERNGSPVVSESGHYYGWAWYFNDATDRLRQEQKFQNVVEQVSDLIAIFKGEDLVVEVANKAVLELWQRNSDVLGKPFETVMPEIRGQGFLEMLMKVLHTGEPEYGYEIPAVFRRKNGVEETIYFNFGYQPYREADGRITGVIIVAKDVTEQVATKQQLVESEARFRTLIEEAPVAAALYMGSEQTIQYANDIMLDYWAKSNAVAGKSFREAFPEHQSFSELLQEVYKTGNTYTAHKEKMQLAINGSQQTCYYNYTLKPLMDEDGEVYGIHHTAIDVTEEVLSQIQLQESEARFRNLVRDASVGIIVLTGEEMRVDIVNDAYAQLIDRKSEELNDKPLFSIIPEAEPVFRPIIDQVRSTGEPLYLYDMPYFVYVGGKKKEGFLNLVYQPYKDLEGHIEGVMILCHDVTRQVQALRKLEEEQERAKMAIEAGDLGLFEINLATNQVIADSRFTEISGFEEIHSIDQYYDTIHPDDLETKDKAIQAGLETGILDFESRIIDSTGEVRWIKLKGRFFFDEDGKPAKVIGMIQDVTAQRNFAEELKKFKHISDHALDAFILMREDGTFAYLNDLALERWGYTREESLHIRVPDVDPIYQEKEFEEVFRTTQQQSIPPFETLHKRKDGTIYPVEVSLTGITLEGKPHMFGVARDITDRKSAEEELLSKNKQLIRINNDLDNFIYTASHDLKAPISNIEGLLTLLSEDLEEASPNQEDINHILTLMQGSVNRFKKTITNLTDIVKLQQEENLDIVKVDLQEVIQDVTLDLRPELDAAGVELKIDVKSCPTIRFSEKNLRSVIYNLLSNALKYRSPDRIPQVHITCSSTDEHQVLAIKDNGLGISSNRIDKLFSMFKRFHDHVEGTGIGLYMVKKIVENAGGRIEVETQVDVGTTFRIYLNK
ncbi:PAS domain S-box protein [Pontibacter sp. JH31]|uniref:histidine kinase n=1 Tax=Pontibacter aquaedesilientis TaxID=2766980 RepID=A0ABR7XHL5_9BACT|nr:PAS domain S-box protein [Pontibacter aquaedesilientis]MBD1397760.1 PAS domain S-box protein [Pontibacter aquaedesilientis]